MKLGTALGKRLGKELGAMLMLGSAVAVGPELAFQFAFFALPNILSYVYTIYNKIMYLKQDTNELSVCEKEKKRSPIVMWYTFSVKNAQTHTE